MAVALLGAAGSVLQARAAATAAHPAVMFSDWPTFHRDAQRAGVSTETAFSADRAGATTTLWQHTEPGVYYSSPVVATIAKLHQSLVFIGNKAPSGHPSTVEAYSASTGQLVWSRAVAGFIEATPAVAGGYVYVGSSQAYMYVLNASTGRTVCRYHASGRLSASPFVATPDAAGPVVYFGDAGVSGGLSDGGHLWAVTAMGNTAGPCQLKWRFDDFGSPAGSERGIAGVFASPSYAIEADGRPVVVVGSTDPDNAEYAVDASDGTLVWRFQTKLTKDGDIGASAAISAPGVNGFADGVAYVIGKDGVAYALDLETGAQLWAHDLTSVDPHALNSESGLALLGGRLFAGYGPDAGTAGGILSLSAEDGSLEWVVRGAPVISSPAVSGTPGDEAVLAADTSGLLRIYAAATGDVLWQLDTGTPSFSSFAVSHGDAFIADLGGNLRALG